MMFSLIVAADELDVIGRDGALPWHLPEDLKRFRALTEGHVVVAGRKTHQSIVERLGRPLPNRTTVVVSQTMTSFSDDVVVVDGVFDAMVTARTLEAERGGDEVFVIGGAQLYRTTVNLIDRVYLTRVHDKVDGDTRMPAGWLDGFTLVNTEDHEGFSFLTYERDT
jgi:dihydrofolate reductase